MAAGCRASALVAPASVAANGLPVIHVADPLAAFVTIVRHLHGRAEPPIHGIDPRAFVHPTATIGSDASVYPFACLGEGTAVGMVLGSMILPVIEKLVGFHGLKSNLIPVVIGLTLLVGTIVDELVRRRSRLNR